jgi:HAE1 family hydrophobic/amphiphilic exporter-1
MLASTCIAVLFIPSFYVLLQRLSERHAARRTSSGMSPDMPPDA